MDLVAFGLNYKTAPLSLRERFAFNARDGQAVLDELRQLPSVQEVTLLSTCNRTEVYYRSKQPVDLLSHLSSQMTIAVPELATHSYEYRDQSALKHMLRVAVGLDSMALGEPQILGQMKAAYQQAEQAGTVGRSFSDLFRHIFQSSKWIRHESAIGNDSITLSSAAIRLVKEVYDDLQSTNVLLLGCGEMNQEVARYLQSEQVGRLWIASQNAKRAEPICQAHSAEWLEIRKLPEVLPQIDVIFCATQSPLPLIGKGLIERSLKQRKHRPQVLIDLALPRDVEPEVGQLEDAFLYNIDDLKAYVAMGLEHRRTRADQAELMVTQAVSAYELHLLTRGADNTICAFRDKMSMLAEAEMQKAKKAVDQGAPFDEVLAQYTKRLMNKWLHLPTIHIKSAAGENQAWMLKAMNKIFELEEKEPIETD